MSWRAIAREVGLNPASLYTYFPSLDDLFTALLLDSYGDLAAATERAATTSPGVSPTERTIDIALAYRAWARAHPAQYNLLFTDQIPGYAAPPGGPTVAAQTAVFEPLVAEFRRLHGADPSEAFMVAVFATLHGLVSLEINHHLDWIDSDHELLMRERIELLLAEGASTTG